jgi:hypothetical protein
MLEVNRENRMTDFAGAAKQFEAPEAGSGIESASRKLPWRLENMQVTGCFHGRGDAASACR